MWVKSKILWTDGKTKKKLTFFCHIVSIDNLHCVMLESRIQSKRPKKRPRTMQMDKIRDCLERKYHGWLVTKIQDLGKWRYFIAAYLEKDNIISGLLFVIFIRILTPNASFSLQSS